MTTSLDSFASLRLDYYLAPLKPVADSDEVDHEIKEHNLSDFRDKSGPFRKVFQVDRHTPTSSLSDPIHFRYLFPVVELLNQMNLNQKCLVRVGDGHEPLYIPTLVKARRIAQPSLCLTIPLNHEQHFGTMRPTLKLDVPWQKKKNQLIWRGATTGPSKGVAEKAFQSRAFIIDVAHRNRENSRIDVGFTKQTKKPFGSLVGFTETLRDPMSIEEQLRYKFLLSLEGNDVATGLKWMMISNSCVLMPMPAIESWFCENLLKPWEHFIPVSPDLADLEEKLDFCLDNEDIAMQVAMQGKEFALQFINHEVERDLFCDVLKWYCEDSRIKDIL